MLGGLIFFNNFSISSNRVFASSFLFFTSTAITFALFNLFLISSIFSSSPCLLIASSIASATPIATSTLSSYTTERYAFFLASFANTNIVLINAFNTVNFVSISSIFLLQVAISFLLETKSLS